MVKGLRILVGSLASVFLLWGMALADILVVDQNDPACSQSPPVYCKIQDAIDDANSGDTVDVKPGTYVEDLQIFKDNLELMGSGCSLTTIEGVATVPGSSFPLAVPNIDIQANGVRIHDFTIRSPTVAPSDYSSGIVLTGTGIEIDHNCFEAGTGDGSQAIQTWALDNAPVGLRDISGLHVHHNHFTHRVPATTAGNVNAYEGVFINEQSDPINTAKPVVVESNRFSGELFRAVATERSWTVIRKNKVSTDYAGPLTALSRGVELRAGFSSGSSSDHLVSKNKIDDKGASVFNWGIRVRDSVSASSLEKNHIRGAAQVGIETGDGSSNTFEKNRVRNSGNDGISVNGDKNSLEKNHVFKSGDNGIVLNGDENTLKKNHIKKSGGLDLDDNGTNNEFKKNKCKKSDPPGLCCSGKSCK